MSTTRALVSAARRFPHYPTAGWFMVAAGLLGTAADLSRVVTLGEFSYGLPGGPAIILMGFLFLPFVNDRVKSWLVFGALALSPASLGWMVLS